MFISLMGFSKYHSMRDTIFKGSRFNKMAPFKTKSRQQNDTIVILQKAFKKARILVLVYGIDILILNHTV